MVMIEQIEESRNDPKFIDPFEDLTIIHDLSKKKNL